MIGDRIKFFFRTRWLPLVVAFLVGFISLLPQISAIIALGDSYQGIHFLYIDDEDNYMAMIRDVVNGHWLAAAPEFFEYKSLKPIMLPFGAYVYAVPMMLFKIPIVWMMLIGKFIFPAGLFLLVYALVKKLTIAKEKWSHELNAIAAGLLVTVGYELVDYHTVWLFLSGQINYPLFSLWTRPVNPITGALLLITFILVVLSFLEKRKIYLFVVAGALQASMVYYFFSWGVSLAISGILLIIFLLRKNYQAAKQIAFSVIVGVLLLFPYWLVVWNSLVTNLGNATAARNGMFFTHQPIINKVLLAATLFFLPFFLYEWRHQKKNKHSLAEWWWICLALLLAGWLAFNQQIITGRTIWPHHFVQYTVALTMIVCLVFIYNYFRSKFPRAWVLFIGIIILASLGYSIAAATTYRYKLNDFKELQSYQPLFTWINANTPKDCVILSTPNAEETITLISALTHCNTYISGQTFIIPEERIMHNLLVWMRLQNIPPEKVSEYLYANPHKISTNFQPDWNQLFNPDTSATWFVTAADRVTMAYTEFYKQDFATELTKYRLDYVATKDELDPVLAKSIRGLRFVTKLDKMQVYEFVPKK